MYCKSTQHRAAQSSDVRPPPSTHITLKLVLLQCWQLKSDPLAMRSHSSGLYFVVLLSHVGSLRCERTAQGSGGRISVSSTVD